MISGGGTAGHVVPALAIADVLSERGCSVEFCGAGYGMESELVPRAGYPFHRVRIRGFERRIGLGTLRTLGSLPVAAVDAWRVLRAVRPACVVGVGAYASGPVVAEAAAGGVATVAVEMDSHLGWTNRALSLVVDRVCLSFPIPGLTGKKFLYTGRPLRPGLLEATREEGIARFGLSEELLTVLVFGGSLGARTLNDAVIEAFRGAVPDFQILHVTGKADYDRVAAAMLPGTERYQAHAYLDDFPLALAAADVAVARAGGSVAELLARGIPSVLVPYPYATGDHQMKNALALQEQGAAVVVPNAELNGARLQAELERLQDPKVRARMREAALRLARPDATERIVGEILRLAEQAGRKN